MKIFQSILQFAVTIAVLTSCSSSPKKTDVATSWPKRIIDAHSHTFNLDENGEYTESKPEEIRKEFLKSMKNAGITASIAHTHTITDGYVDMRKDNVFHCVGARPPYSPSKIDKALQKGQFKCIKIYLGYIPAYATDPVYKPAYALAEKHKVPVVFHTGDVSSSDALVKYADPISIDEIAVRYRKINFVIAHAGNPWIQTAAEIAYKNPNVYLDGSGILMGNLDKLSKETVKMMLIDPLKWIFTFVENPKKIMFGSDYPLVDIKSYINAFKEAIPQENWDDVFYNNAVNVFKIKTGELINQ